MQNKTIWITGILLVIATMFSIIALSSGTALSENSNLSLVDDSSRSIPNISNDGRYILLKAAQFNTEKVPSISSISTMGETSSSSEDYYIVQFRGYILEEWKQDVRNSGATIFHYIPNNAFIVRMDPSVKVEVNNLDCVQWIGPYYPSYRVDPSILSLSEDGGKLDIVVMLFDPVDNKRIINEINELGGDIVDNSGDIIRVRINKTNIPDVAALNGVYWIDSYAPLVLLNNNATIIMNITPSQNSFYLNGSEQIIGIADTGLDTGINDSSMHDDLEGRIKKIYSWNDSDASDGHGHGTHVAGSAIGNGSNSSGLYSGAAPGAQLVFQAIGDSAGNLYSVDLNDLFTQAYSDGVRIHSDSWGVNSSSKYGSYTERSQAVDDFMWNHPDMLIIFAAGNSRQYSTDESILPPATAKNCLSVGASENLRPPYLSADDPDEIASFSSKGPTDDGRIKPDVIAPGTWIASTRSSQAGTGNYWDIIDDDYAYMGGTSMSTPLTAGAAALVRQYYVENDQTSPSAALIKATLVNGAVDTGNSINDQGWGRINLNLSLFPSSPISIRYFDNKTGLNNESWYSEEYIVSGRPLKLSLVWTDYPASFPAANTLVNNLDLILESPNSTIYYGNGLPDSKNNVEQIYLEVPETGWYTITVNGISVPEGPQPFALVMSGAFGNDTIAPSSVRDLNGIPGETWINWSWINPDDPDFSHVELYLDGHPLVTTDSTFYNATGLIANTSYELGTRTVDNDNNINSSWVNLSISTTADNTAPSSVSDLTGIPGETSINWSWINPDDPDFSHVEVYLDGILNTTTNLTFYNATGLTTNVTYELSTRTVDSNGNINLSWVNDTATTLDLTAPSSVRDLNGIPGETWINWSWTNPDDPDFIHVEVYLNGILNTTTNSTFYNSTGLTANTSYELSTRTADTSDNINSSWVNLSVSTDSDTTAPSSIIGLTSTTGETWINWSWSTPSDSDFDHVELYLDNIFVMNASSTSYNTTGLVADTVYKLSTRTVDISGNINSSWVNLSVSTSTTKLDGSPSSSRSSSGGGGGGSGATGEAFENIAFKDVKTENIITGLAINYVFDDEQNPIRYINFSALKNSGRISTIIEVLKSRSSMVDTTVPGTVYSNLNIWVGKSGFATEDNIADPVIGFSVSKEWFSENGIDENSIVLFRYSEGKWNALNTGKIGEDVLYLYFEAETPGFSPFAIAAEVDDGPVNDVTVLTEEESGSINVSSTSTITETSVEKENVTESEEATGSGTNMLFIAILVIIVLVLLTILYVVLSKGYNAK